MGKIIKIAWRNIWRSRLRSLVVIFSIILGIWAVVFVVGVSYGVSMQRQSSALKHQYSHIQIHNPDYIEDFDAKYTIDQSDKLLTFLEGCEEVEAFSERIKINGMISSSRGGSGVLIYGVDPQRENTLTAQNELITEGKWFEGIKRNPIVIGSVLAEKLKVKVRSKIVLTLQDDQKEIVTGAFRVAGIYKGLSSKTDKINVFVRKSDLGLLIGSANGIHEIALNHNSVDSLDLLVNKIEANFLGSSVRTWDVVSPELGYTKSTLDTTLYIIVGIILLAIAFGIINTMLMAVLERKRELGMLISIGMTRSKVFFLVVIETIFLSLMGGPGGLLLAFGTIEFFKRRGIDLSSIKEGLEALGVSSIIYPSLDSKYYLNILIMVVMAAILSSIYPAIRALKVNPAEAVKGK